jgi:hypothetical protein
LRIAHVILVTVASWFLTLQARAADAVAAPSDVHTMALLRLTAASGDKMIEELVRGTLKDSHRWVLVKTAPSAEYLARLEISRRAGGTELALTVSKREAGLLVHAQQYVTAEESVIDGAQLLVAQVNAALDGKPIPAHPAPDRPVLKPLPETLRPAAGKGKRFDGSDDTDDRHLDFIVGLEGAFGPMSLSTASVASGSQTFDLTHYAPAFTQSIDGHAHGAIALHAGTKFLGLCAFEFAYQASRWSGPGAATLWGPRLSFFPLGALWPEHKLEAGIDLGFGYSFINGGSYDMSGTYFALGLTFEYPITPSFGVVGYYRLFTPFLKNFYYDYASNLSEPTGGVTALWNTFGIGLNWHPSIRW